ncbi:hypothetical protein F4678DRAFT_456664 [Xylaria arbuscula]|nr:hypothetical protein F4678DRAFT_456664 [Xylaria arbuscula]
MSTYEARRLENIKRNETLVRGLGLQGQSLPRRPAASRKLASKGRKLPAPRPTRASARIASASSKLSYAEVGGDIASSTGRLSRYDKSPLQQQGTSTSPTTVTGPLPSSSPELSSYTDLEVLKARWSSWTPSAELPTRDDEGNYHFDSHPLFTPNKSPEAIIREGSFGGSYWRPLYSRHLRTTISGDWEELPKSWTDGLSVNCSLTSDTYDAEANKYGVACSQSIEEWEAAVLKKYIQNGVRTVTDEDDEIDEKKDVSPVVHQTCHHWAWEVRQEALDRFWSNSV